MKLYSRLPDPRPIEQYDIVVGRGVEPEVGAMLYALVRMAKPTICVETGLYVGDSAEWIGKALKDNKKGSLVTCDVDNTRIAPARARFVDLPIEVCEMRGIDVLRRYQTMDFVHIDSGAFDVRKEELMSLGDHNISPGGIVCYHDALRDMHGVYAEFAEGHDWPHLMLNSYVGMAIFVRPEV